LLRGSSKKEVLRRKRFFVKRFFVKRFFVKRFFEERGSSLRGSSKKEVRFSNPVISLLLQPSVQLGLLVVVCQ